MIIKDKIAVLGSGITAQSVWDFAKKFDVEIVSIEQATLIIASPGIPPSQYPQTSTPIISDIEWAYRLFQMSPSPPKLIAVTGTNGKSTVTAMIAHICDIPYAGNIGVPLLNYVGLETEFPCIVVEVSSYQLETCSEFCPEIVVLTTLSPDHLERHKTMKAYIDAKKNCFKNQTANNFLIYNAEDPGVVEMVEEAEAVCEGVSYNDISDKFELLKTLLGKHNHLNAAIALKVADSLGLDPVVSFRSLHTFKSLKHRLEYVCDYQGIRIYNDSKSTNPESTIIALEAFAQPVWLICCGEDKNLDLNQLFKSMASGVKGLIVFGEIADRMGTLFKEKCPHILLRYAESLTDATDYGIKNAQAGDVLLFSPASSSYDLFNGFEDRGNQFINVVNNYVEASLV